MKTRQEFLKTARERQKRFRDTHKAKGLCILCSEPFYKSSRCKRHYKEYKIYMNNYIKERRKTDKVFRHKLSVRANSYK